MEYKMNHHCLNMCLLGMVNIYLTLKQNKFLLDMIHKMFLLRLIFYLQNKEHALEIMKRHAEVLKPRFDAVLKALEEEIRPAGIGHWETPKGGYFISLYTLPGLAKRTVALTKEAGVILTGAGATFPYGKDPEDSNIRIAPSLPPTAELEQAIEVLCTALKLAALEQLNA